ncbi:MAG: glucoamylase family protein, partial [Longimicrobiales bacterium]
MVAVRAPSEMASVGGGPLALLGATMPLLLLWLFSPAIAHALGAPAVAGELRLTQRERAHLLRYAQLHWHYFDEFVSAKTNWLTPDNFQEDPRPVIAARTSPTNIGLQLLSTASAADLGFITRPDMIERIERVFETLDRMPRFRGHFYNWYDLSDLHVLDPRYVSTVDSGNLAGALIALKQACLAIAEEPAVPADDVARLVVIANRAKAFVLAMDFTFLYDENRKLFSIGYRESDASRDNSYYDLLASEARLASFLAVAKNDVPVEHWFRLGRTLTGSSGDATLVSWSGSMFEYLMPLLIMRTFPSTLLDHTYHGAVHRQIRHGRDRGVPWGVSESAYNLRDRNGTYQYRAFGVPGLGLKRGLGGDMVVAPYATLLALLVEPRASLQNLRALEHEGALGDFGFRDALDYTRHPPEQNVAVIGAYMAHHIGMGLVAIANSLQRQVWQRRFHADALVKSAELLLHERIPSRLGVQEDHVETAAEEETRRIEGGEPVVRQILGADTPQPRVALLGFQPYTMLVTNAGGGFSRFDNLAVTRWRADGTRDNYGQWCYVRDLTDGRAWSATHQPMCTQPDYLRTDFSTDRARYIRVDGPIETQTEIVVVPEDAAEVRRVTVLNRSDEDRVIELTSYGEIVLAPADAERAHPAFANLFVQTEWLPSHSAIIAARRPRAAGERTPWLVHVVATGPELLDTVSFETDRARFIGRGRSTADPAALEQDTLSESVGAVLDPIFALRVRLRVPAGGTATASFTTSVAPTREAAIEIADRYDDPYAAQRALDLSWAHAQVELREFGITPASAALYQKLAGHLLFPNASMRASREEQQSNRMGQTGLWSMGISGDWPILLAIIESEDGLPSVRDLLRAHHYWRMKGITTDLVILNTHAATYLQDLSDRILAAVVASTESGLVDVPGGVFIRRVDILSPDELLLLRATARVHVVCDGIGLGRLLDLPDAEPA